MLTSSTSSYRAVRIRQTSSGGWLVLFAAPATEIGEWAGIPQKKKIGGTQETTGFQREEDKKRIKELVEFYSNDNNVIQNPLLCATRYTDHGTVSFEPDANIQHSHFVETGMLRIQSEPLYDLSLLELLQRVKSDLEIRVPSLASEKPSEKMLVELKIKASSIEHFREAISAFDVTDSYDEETSETLEDITDSKESTGTVFSDESHIYDFWEEVAARVQLLKELGTSYSKDEFLDYTKDAMISFLRPIVVVDGQHRLRGAVESAKFLSRREPYSDEIEQAIIDGADPTAAQKSIESKISRHLPISLLITNDPAEHVFQFVVVNQKATPIGKALLGTIVSTSLSNDELTRVSERLEKSGIRLEESRAVAYLSRNPDSPFYRLVERGLSSEKDLLQWTVLRSLVHIFQELKGGRVFGEKIDWAYKWSDKFLKNSAIAEDWQSKGFTSARDYWSSFDGPWRDVFISFWIVIRDEFASVEDENTNNYWGSPAKSNIFNKVSLTILSADFFQFLCEKDQTIDDVESIRKIVDRWLVDVDRTYFNRPWKLSSGLRKDTPKVREKWAKLWVDYRKEGESMPKVKDYDLK